MTYKNMIYTYLCVGGPLDGKRHEDDKPWFRIHNFSRSTVPLLYALPGEETQQEPVFTEVTTYILTSIRTGTGKLETDIISFWRPDDMTMFDCVKKLLERYEQTANIHPY